MIIKKTLFLCMLIAGLYSRVYAQYFPHDTTASKGFDSHKLFTGGSMGLSFGNITYINLSPLIGYRFSALFAGGVQINGQYESVRYKNQYGDLYQKDKYGLAGIGVFGRVYPIPQIFIHLQPEMDFIFGKSKYYDGTPDRKFQEHVPAFLAGLGYSQNIGGSSAFNLMLLYDVLQKKNSPYGNKPIFRAEVDLGF